MISANAKVGACWPRHILLPESNNSLFYHLLFTKFQISCGLISQSMAWVIFVRNFCHETNKVVSPTSWKSIWSFSVF